MSLLGVAPSYIVLLILLFIMGIAASTFHVPAPVMIKEISGSRIGKGMSFFMLGGELARSIGPLVVLGGVSLWGLEGIYKLIPFGLTASIILFFRFRNLTVKVNNTKIELPNILLAFKEHLSLFIIILGIFVFTSVAKGTITTFLTVFLTESGNSLWFAGISLSIFQLAGAGGTLFAGTISDKIGRKNVLLVSATLNPILLFLFIILPDVISIITLILLGFSLFAFTPVMLAMVNERKSEFPTFINGIFMTINFLSGAVAVSLVGVMADFFTLNTTYYLSAILSLGTIPFVLKIKS
jgi:FSR family fosmidomycin resistance protein-like MFS transporter